MSPRWDENPSTGLLEDCLTRLALEVQPSIRNSPLRQQALFQRLQKREYTTGEILYAVDKLSDDPVLDDKLRYGGDLSAADFKRVIDPLRKIKERLEQGKILTEDEVWQAIETIPELDRRDFGSCRDSDETRRFVLKSGAEDKL